MDIRSKIDEYIDFLKKSITYRQLEVGYEITTPFLNPSNDHLQIYVQELYDNEIILSDGGDTLSYLSETATLYPERKNIIKNMAKSYGVSLSTYDELTIKTSPKDFAQKEHGLIQAMLKVYDLSFTSRTKSASGFVDEVASYFARNEIPFSKDIIKLGRTGYNQKYDFLLNAYKRFPERFCDAISPNLSNAFTTIFSWTDIEENRAPNSQFYVFINDRIKCDEDIVTAFDQYHIHTVFKSEMNTEKTLRNFKEIVS